jgi:transposase
MTETDAPKSSSAETRKGSDPTKLCKLIVAVHGMGGQKRGSFAQQIARLFARHYRNGSNQATPLPYGMWYRNDQWPFASPKDVEPPVTVQFDVAKGADEKLKNYSFAEVYWAHFPRALTRDGYDGAKKMKGCKRHVLVDTQGWVLTAKVHTADVMDRDGVTLLLPPEKTKEQFPRLSHVWLDASYNGQDKGQDWIEKELGWMTQIVNLPPQRVIIAADVEPAPRPAFTVLPRRWVVERTFSWLGQSRRLSKEYERLCATSEALIYATMSRLMVRRLAQT